MFGGLLQKVETDAGRIQQSQELFRLTKKTIQTLRRYGIPLVSRPLQICGEKLAAC